LGDFLVRVALCDKSEHLDLTRAEAVWVRRPQAGHQLVGDGGRQNGLAAGDDADRAEQIFERGFSLSG